ncbi:MAG: diguanylate cyclase, partial [Oscillospiraceae bacterium]|nr:diguanylate cyclase [Oscillospiraceae bacterium]
DDLLVETEDAIAGLESNLRSDRTMLRVIAGLIGNADDIDSIEVSGYLANYDVNSMITQIGILLPGNEIVTSRGHRPVKTSIDCESEAVLGEHISGLQPSATNSNATVINNYVPIRKDGICIGVLYSAASPSNMAKAWMPSIYDKKGYCYVVNRKTGEVIINTTNDQIRNINDISFTKVYTDYTKEDTVKNILDGRKGYSVFRSEMAKERIYMCYLPFSIEDWEMVALVPESAAFSSAAPVRNGMYSMIIAAVAVIAVYAIWLIREVRASIAETEQKANTDALTGLQNRNCYETYLRELNGSSEKLTCVYIDANGLHEINNTQGHFAGDQMLRFIADTLKVQFGGDHLYRIGGDEFVVFVFGMSDSQMNECLSNFRDALQRNDYHAAVGTCVYGSGMSIDELIKNAEKEMYEAKQKYYEQIGKVMRV